jgi:hypothetical protein
MIIIPFHQIEGSSLTNIGKISKTKNKKSKWQASCCRVLMDIIAIKLGN